MSRRRIIAGVLVVGCLFAGYMFWFRESSFVTVEEVEVTGTGLSAEVDARLREAAVGLSTLHLDRSALEDAVAEDPTVVGLKLDARFPHGLTIDVETRVPAGWLDADGGALIAADGVVLETDVDRPEGLPAIEAEQADLADRAEGEALAVARVLGAMPAPIAAEVDEGRIDAERGVVVEVTGGIELRFGAPRSAVQKWRAATAVLADPGLTSATYVDLSVPSRPAVG